MRLKTTLIPVGALVMALGYGGLSAEAGQRDRNGRDRNGRASRGNTPDRQDNTADQARGDVQGGGARANGSQNGAGRYEAPAPPAYGGGRQDEGRDNRQAYNQNGYRGNEHRGDDRYYDNRRSRDNDRRYDDHHGSRPPVFIRPAPRHYYGPGGGFNVYFGLGSGYLYGSAWSGRVYGYTAPRAYGAPIYYGDVRLQVQPRNAAVFVDGYYAGVVDDFDGVFQRLTLEVGPHHIELDAPGLEPRTFEIYADPSRTVNVRMDLFR